MEGCRRTDYWMPREGQLLLSREDPSVHLPVRAARIDHDQLELPQLRRQRDQHLAPEPPDLAEENNQTVPREGRIRKYVDVAVFPAGGHRSIIASDSGRAPARLPH